MNFGVGMTCEIMISNGTLTVGYVNGKPAEWVGNNKPLTVEWASILFQSNVKR